jgi:hypothetical protein
LHEYTAFGTLRSGAHIQWLNILRELRAQTLSLDRREVQILLLQAVWQIGEYDVSSDICTWHQDLCDTDFGHALLSEIDNVLTNIQENWLHLISLETLSRIIARLLASATDKGIKSHALNLLKKARAIAYCWVYELAKKLEAAKDDTAANELQTLLYTAALVCRTTYDVDDAHIKVLLEGKRDVSTFLECMIRAYDNIPAKVSSGHLSDLMSRDRRLSHSTIDIISKRIQSDRECLDLTITKLWDGYSLGSSWHPLAEPSDRWFTCISKAGDGRYNVHVNILNGSLLINGKPLNRLPRTITQHNTYQRLFGRVCFMFSVLKFIPF